MTLRDDLGRRVALAGPARRIVSLSPATTECLFAIGAGALVVGVTGVDDYPPPVRSLPRVGDFTRPSYERLALLRPDLLVFDSATVQRADVEKLAARAKTPAFAQKSLRYEDVARHLEQLGALTGREAAARRAAQAMREAAAQVARRVAGKPPASVFVEVSETPLYAAGERSFVGDLVRLAGGKNIVAGADPFPVFSREALLAADPAHYVLVTGKTPEPPRHFRPPLDRLRAVREGNVHAIPADLLFRPTPRLAQGLQRLAAALHP